MPTAKTTASKSTSSKSASSKPAAAGTAALEKKVAELEARLAEAADLAAEQKRRIDNLVDCIKNPGRALSASNVW